MIKRNMSLFAITALCIAVVGCGDGGGSSSGASSAGANPSGKINAEIVRTIDVPIVYDFLFSDVHIDGDNLILAGGLEYSPNLGVDSLNGHPAFSDRVLNYNLVTDEIIELQMSASNGVLMEDGSLSNGRNGARINKIGPKKFLIYDGYISVNNAEIADFENRTTTRIDVNTLSISRSVALDNGDTYFFGAGPANGFPSDAIVKFDANNQDFITMNATMGSPRYFPVVRKLKDGKIMVVGGYDNTVDVSPDSANRRVEIYNPLTDSIERIDNYPQPLRSVLDSTRFTEKLDRSNEDSVCVYSYQYNFSTASWMEGCEIIEPNVTILGMEYAPYESFYPTYDPNIFNNFLFKDGAPIFLGELSTGYYAYIRHGYFSAEFSDELDGSPIEENTKIYVVKFEN